VQFLLRKSCAEQVWDVPFYSLFKDRYPGFRHAELKPLTENGYRAFLRQLEKWGFPLDDVSLWFYNIGRSLVVDTSSEAMGHVR